MPAMQRAIVMVPLAALLAACGAGGSGSTALPAQSSGPSAPASGSTADPASTTQGAGASHPRIASVPRPHIGSVIAVAKHLYGNEINGGRVHRDLRFVASNQVLLNDLSRGDLAAAQAEAYRQMTGNPVDHITRVSVTNGRRTLVNAVWNGNGVFVVAPQRQTLYFQGRRLGTLLVSVQDVVGYVKLIHKYTGALAVVRGGSGQVRSSLAAAAHVSLPSSGYATIEGTKYIVGSFHLAGWGHEPLTAWVLEPA
jgi:hypothetical protein